MHTGVRSEFVGIFEQVLLWARCVACSYLTNSIKALEGCFFADLQLIF